MPLIATVPGQTKDLGGGFMIRRLLPSPEQRSVGPFVFMDHFGPTVQREGESFDVRPHPHIGLATVSYLFEGAITHRDSLGCVREIEPGAINWMTAGRGIVHSERTPVALRPFARSMHGIQLWAALPRESEEIEPAFVHTPAGDIPVARIDGMTLRVLIGGAFGLTSPVATLSPTLYLDVEAAHGGVLMLPADDFEKAVYPLTEPLEIDGRTAAARQLTVLATGLPATITAPEAGRYVILGGAPLGHRHIWWNFVSSRRERIEQAKEDWREQRFARVPGETEFIPLPDR